MERSTSLWRTAAVLALAAGVACSGIRTTPPTSQEPQEPQVSQLTPPCSWQKEAISGFHTGDVIYDIASVDDYYYSSSSSSYYDNFVWAVGGFHDNGLAAALEYAHHEWRLDKVIEPSSSLNVFFGAGADKVTNVWAVGEYFNAHNRYVPLVERFNGKTWSEVITPSLSYGGYLGHVNAYSPTDVWMDGVELTSTSTFKGLLEHWDGHRIEKLTYNLQPKPPGNYEFTTAPLYMGNPTNPSFQVLGLNEDRLNVTIGALAVRQNLTEAFSIKPILSLKGYKFSYVDGITSYGTYGLLAVGYYQKDPTLLPRPMAQWWNGSRFEQLSPPSKGLGASLLDAAYSPTFGGLAVGVYDANKHTQYPYALLYNGKDWRDAMAPQVPGVYTAITPVAGTKDYWVAFNGEKGDPGIYHAKCNSF